MPGVQPGSEPYHFVQPTRIAGGSGSSAGVGEWVATYGTRVLVVLGDSHVRASGLFERVEGSLRAAGVVLEVLEGVPPNPSVAVVDAGTTLARAWRADVVLAVGGGSVIDAAKAIAVAARGDGRSFRDHLSGSRAPDLLVADALPVVALPTLPGSGSETNGTSVVSDDATGAKWSAHSELATPRIAILDPALAVGAPAALLGPGLADAWCHALEAALSVRATVASNSFAEAALRSLREDSPTVLDADLGESVRAGALARAWWASNLAGQALTAAGSIVTHPLAHPLSALLGARHGSAVAALEPAVLVVFAARFAEAGSLGRVASWLDVRHADRPDAALRGILNRFAGLCADLGVTQSAADLGLTSELTGDVVRAARASGSRGLANLPGGEPTADELFAVLDAACEVGPAVVPKRLLEFVDAAVAARSDIE